MLVGRCPAVLGVVRRRLRGLALVADAASIGCVVVGGRRRRIGVALQSVASCGDGGGKRLKSAQRVV